MPFLNLNSVRESEPVPGYRGRFVHCGSMTIAYWSIKSDSTMPEHAHPHEQIVNLIEGEFELTLGDETRIMRPGDIAAIPPNLPHGGKSISDCLIIDVFHPVREDFKQSK